MAIASRAADMRSPVERSMSISLAGGLSEISFAISISSSVVSPRADTTATTGCPAFRASTMRPATRLIQVASATDEPPNFMTTMLVRSALRSGRG